MIGDISLIVVSSGQRDTGTTMSDNNSIARESERQQINSIYLWALAL
jgi:hypothetical protein